ncbi:glycosyltransferase family A protein [Bacillus sp. JCM 19034]|uniref:glycosyltransferase family 2 protein n=1 Tax=Bacillus sp. JCM 19034 TaxID=1481928 RepID=UPI0009E9464D
MKKIDDSRVRYVQQDKHINGAAARNVGIRVSKGEYIAFLDDDDEWLPNKIELQVREIENNKDCEGVTCLYTIYNNGKPIRKLHHILLKICIKKF